MSSRISHTGFMHVITPHPPRPDGREFATYKSPSAFCGGGWDEDYIVGNNGAYEYALIEKVHGNWTYVRQGFWTAERVVQAAREIPVTLVSHV